MAECELDKPLTTTEESRKVLINKTTELNNFLTYVILQLV